MRLRKVNKEKSVTVEKVKAAVKANETFLNCEFISEHHEYEKLISSMNQSELIKLACIAIGLAVNSNAGKIETSPHVSEGEIFLLKMCQFSVVNLVLFTRYRDD